jgi:hypothetical protein
VPLVPTRQEAGLASQPVLTLWRREKFCPCWDSKPDRTLQTSYIRVRAKLDPSVNPALAMILFPVAADYVTHSQITKE